MDALSSFTIETFRDRVGQRFALAHPAIELELLRVSEGTPGGLAGGRSPFALLFRGPTEHPLPQGIVDLTHPELGEFGLFVVPVSQEPDGFRYEAVFS